VHNPLLTPRVEIHWGPSMKWSLYGGNTKNTPLSGDRFYGNTTQSKVLFEVNLTGY
jgi:hypothetical protein